MEYKDVLLTLKKYRYSLLTKDHIKTYTWKFYDDKNNIVFLVYKQSRIIINSIYGKYDNLIYKFYYKINKNTFIISNDDFEVHINKFKPFLEKMQNNVSNNDVLIKEINKYIGDYSYYKNNDYIWDVNLKYLHIYLQFNYLKNTFENNITLKYKSHDTDKQTLNLIGKEKLIEFLKEQNLEKNVVYRENNKKQLSNQKQKDYFIKNENPDKKMISNKYKNLFIKLHKSIKIHIQSCISPPNEYEYLLIQ